MRRQRGWTLIELMGSLSLIGTVCVVVGGLALQAEHTRDLGAAYASDIAGSRRALDAVERDLRAAHDVRVAANSLVAQTDAGDVVWKLEGTSLRRGDEVLARNVATFDAKRDGDVVEVSLALGRRSPVAKRTAAVTTSVRMRASRETAK